MLTGAKTEINGKNDPGPSSSFIFFMDGTDLKVFDTRTDTTHSVMTSGEGLSGFPSSIAYYDNHFMFTNSMSLYHYQIGGGFTSNFMMGGSPMALINHYGDLYISENTGNLCYITSHDDNSPTCNGTSFSLVTWLMNSYDGTLYACSNSTLSVITGAGTGSPSISAANGSPTCNPQKTLFGGRYFAHDGGTSIGTFDTESSALVSQANASFTGISMSHEGIFFFEEGAGNLKAYDPHSTSISSVSGTYKNGPVHSSPEGELFFICDDGGNAQVCRFRNGVVSHLSNFTYGYTSKYLTLGPEGFYFFHSGGIDKVGFDGGTTNVFSGTIGTDFTEINEHEMHN